MTSFLNYGHLFAYAWGGAFLANAVPHYVCGVMGRPFQSPFARPPGLGESSSTVNVLWGFFNLLVGYGLTTHIGSFQLAHLPHAGALFAGALVMSLFLARHFGKIHGGDQPKDAPTRKD